LRSQELVLSAWASKRGFFLVIDDRFDRFELVERQEALRRSRRRASWVVSGSLVLPGSCYFCSALSC